ncbi:MAG: SynChlorMet cassette protein ScmC [Anaerolineae bacterium]
MCQRTVVTAQSAARLSLANGTGWVVAATNDPASKLVAELAKVMQLSVSSLQDAATCYGFLTVAGKGDAADAAGLAPGEAQESARVSLWLTDRLTDGRQAPNRNGAGLPLGPIGTDDLRIRVMVRLSSLIALTVEREGGLLVHGALAERDGFGVVLAGPGGIGKTTASRRLSPPWHSLSDDATLIVRDADGAYWAHPWPTWSRFMLGGPGGTWDVQRAVPLRGIFFLYQDASSWTDMVETSEAAASLVQSAEQILGHIQSMIAQRDLRALRLRRFDNISSMVRTVPCYVLHVDLESPFWEVLDRRIGGTTRP